MRKDVRVGDTVVVERAGDVIPHILAVDINKRPKKNIKFVFPKNCPSCGSKTTKEYNEITKKNDAVRRCTSEGYEWVKERMMILLEEEKDLTRCIVVYTNSMKMKILL